MSRPIIYWQSMTGDDLPSEQDSYLWNKEPDADNDTHVGTKFVGDEDEAVVGLDFGSMTNLQESDDFMLLVSHSAEEPLTNCQFYYAVSKNNRGDATGFANEDEEDGSKTGLEKDFDEIRAWGDGKLTADGDVEWDNDEEKCGVRIRYKHNTDPEFMATEKMDELDYAMMVDNKAKCKGNLDTEGDSPDGEESWVEPWSDYLSNDALFVNSSIKIPDIDAAGVRQCGLVLRCTYTYGLVGLIAISSMYQIPAVLITG